MSSQGVGRQSALWHDPNGFGLGWDDNSDHRSEAAVDLQSAATCRSHKSRRRRILRRIAVGCQWLTGRGSFEMAS